MELNTVGSDIEYGSILGGNRDDYGYAISVDDVGNAYLTGSTNTPDFPNGFNRSPDFIPGEDAFQPGTPYLDTNVAAGMTVKDPVSAKDTLLNKGLMLIADPLPGVTSSASTEADTAKNPAGFGHS